MAIYVISKKEYEEIRHDQKWGIHNCLLFIFKKKRYKCNVMGPAGLKEINRFQHERIKIERDQLGLLGI